MATKVKQKNCTTPVLIAKSTSPVNKYAVAVAAKKYTTAFKVLDKMAESKKPDNADSGK